MSPAWSMRLVPGGEGCRSLQTSTGRSAHPQCPCSGPAGRWTLCPSSLICVKAGQAVSFVFATLDFYGSLKISLVSRIY